MEADIRAAQVELNAVGMMVENKRGTPIPHPLILAIDTLERRQLAVIRSMSLNRAEPMVQPKWKIKRGPH